MENDNIHVKELASGTTLCNGKYVIERVIGVGGFGITYYARHTILNHEYAIKEFFISGKCARNTQHFTIYIEDGQEGEFEKYRKKFVAEAQTLLSLDHPGIVKIIDIFEENNTSYIVMNFIPGVTLQYLVQKNGKLPYEVAVNYMAQLCEAVGYIHERHVLHRDIKPENVMITPQNRVVLLDFGSAREFVNDEVQNQTAILTRGYAPPEQYSVNSRKGNYTDIYALGALFYFCVTGVKPIDAASRSIEVMQEPVELNRTLPQAANRTIMKAMQLKPEDRHQTVEEFMEDLLGVKASSDPEDKRREKPSQNSHKKHLPWILGICLGILVLGACYYFLFHASRNRTTIIEKTSPNSNIASSGIQEDTQTSPVELVFRMTGSGEEYQYEGELDANGLPHGKGKALFVDRSYEGGFVHGEMEGQGVMTFNSGNRTFLGRFENGSLVEGRKEFETMIQEGTFESISIINGTEVNKEDGSVFYYYEGNIVDKSIYLKKIQNP